MKKITVLLLVVIFADCGSVEKKHDSTLAAGFKKDSPLLPSGLLGPVQLITSDKN